MFFALKRRHKARNGESDQWRFGMLFQAMDSLEQSLQAEKQGLQKRRESIAATAAFAQQRYENDRRQAALSSRVDEMTCTMKDYAHRLDRLQRQIDLIRRLRHSARTQSEAQDERCEGTRFRAAHQ